MRQLLATITKRKEEGTLTRRTKWAVIGFVGLLLVCVATAATLLFLNANKQPPVGTKIGETAPSFTLEDLDGVSVSLSDFYGRVVILEFWQTSCPDCRKAMPHLKTLYARYKDKGLVWLGVNLDHDPEVVKAYLKDSGFLDQITLWGSFSAAMDIVDLFDVDLVPRTLIIDRQGIIRYAGTYPDEPQTSDIETWL